MHGPKSKFIMKVVQVKKQEEFSKGGRRFLKLKKMGGGEERNILKQMLSLKILRIGWRPWSCNGCLV